VNSRDGAGQCALHWAAEVGHAGMCRTLVALGADMEAAGNNLSRPLHVSAREGHCDATQVGLQRCTTIANRNVRVWGGATENGP
jgi:hypothetical protein